MFSYHIVSVNNAFEDIGKDEEAGYESSLPDSRSLILKCDSIFSPRTFYCQDVYFVM